MALSVPGLRQSLPVRKYGALCCPDFPPCRNNVLQSDKVACITKIQNSGKWFQGKNGMRNEKELKIDGLKS